MMLNFDEKATSHWEYVKSVIRTHVPDIEDDVLNIIGFHYKTAMCHGYKHGYEDAMMLYVNSNQGDD